MSPLARALLAAIAALPFAAAAQPLGYDPSHVWRTLETPHFRIHFPEALEPLARQAAVHCEDARARLAPLIAPGRAAAGRTEVVLSDDSDDANGSATAVPYRAMHLRAVPPPSLSELNDHRDWLRSLVFHEYVHVLHLDEASGVPGALNRVFGKLFAPNGLLPPWYVEGLATRWEGEAGTGRNASALFDMAVRAMVRDGAFPQLDDVSNPPLDWPRGASWYLLGGRFLDHVAAASGDPALAALARDQGDELWPWRSSTLAARHLGGRGWPEWWESFRRAEEARYGAQLEALRAAGTTPFRALTQRGGRVHHPRWSPDGAFVAYFDQGLDGPPELRRVSPDGRDLGPVARVDGNGTLALPSTDRAVVAVTEILREFRVYDDLWTIDLSTGERERLTEGERASDPDVTADGAILYVAQGAPGRGRILRRPPGGGPPETVLDRPGAELFFPRASPDGRRIAFEIQEGGTRDVAVLEDGAVRFLTRDDAIDAQPAWSPDGLRLYFASDRGGVYDLWAWQVEDGRIRRVTRVETGAFEPAPSPDGKRLAFVTYSARGYDLAVMELDADPVPATESNPGLSPNAIPSVPLSLRAAEGRGEGGERLTASAPAPLAPPRPYSAFPTVLPHWWLPFVGSDGDGTTLGVLTGGRDVVGRHAWGLSAQWGLESERPGYDLAYQAGWLYPHLTIGSRHRVGTAAGPSDQLESRFTPLELALTWTRTRLAQAQSLTVGWYAYRLHALGGPEPVVEDPTVDPYRNGTASTWTISALHTSAERFARSISPERGRTLAVSLEGAAPELGGTFRYAAAEASWTEYVGLGRSHAVLALRGAGGIATGTLGGRRPFELGGLPPPDALSLVLTPLLGGAAVFQDTLRGYADGVLTGSRFALANAELRFPLLAPEAGSGTLPAQLRRVHGAVFLDAGGTFPLRNGTPGLGWRDRIRFGTGAELRLELALAYQLVTDLRLGFAQGLGTLLASERRGPGGDPLAETQLYVTLGGAF